MDVLLIALLSGVGFVVAYHTYGRWLGKKIFRLSADAVCPAVSLNDGKDFVPTPKSVVFGHHFTSIAGTGPIVGPAIAVMWGWLPALLWVIFGSIFIGAVHDLGSLVVSLRNKGQTVGDIAGRVIHPRTRILFLLILAMALTVVLAIFGLVIANVFKLYPSAIFPCVVQVPLAVVIGVHLHRRGVNLLIPSIITLVLMYLSVAFGDVGFLHQFNMTLAAWPIWVWTALLLIYSYVASVLPVWALLQPRDYINSLQLISALGLIVVGLCVAAFIGGAPPIEGADRQELKLVAPAVDLTPSGAPLLIPFLFITVACGAISGFHCLVSSGTSSKQLKNESDARFVGYGAMLTEGFLAVLVILACCAGLGLGAGLKFQTNSAFFGSETATVQPSTGQPFTIVKASGMAGPYIYPESNESFPLAERPGFLMDSGVLTRSSIKPIPVDASGDTWNQVIIDEAALVGPTAFSTQYQSWKTSGGLANTVGAFVTGAGNFVAAIGVPKAMAIALMGVLVASFAGTTMDTACRLQRYVIQELARTVFPVNATSSTNANIGKVFSNAHVATILACVSAAVVAAIPPDGNWSLANAGRGGMMLWPLFGATNQLLGGLAFLVILFYLRRRNLPTWFIAIPAVFMLIMPAWAMTWSMFVDAPGEAGSWLEQKRWTLFGIAGATLALEAWMIVEAIRLYRGVRNVLEPTDEQEPSRGFEVTPASSS